MHVTRRPIGRAFLFIAAIFLAAAPAWGEEVEFVTYYPAPASIPDPLYVNQAGIGAGNRNQPLPTNGLAVQGKVCIGTRTTDASAALLQIDSTLSVANEDLLLVRGPDDGRGRVLFVEGTDVPGNGGPSLEVGIGTDDPIDGTALDIVRSYDAAYIRIRSTGFGDPDNYSAIEFYNDLSPLGPANDKRWQLANRQTSNSAIKHNFQIGYYDPANAALGWQPHFVISKEGNIGLGIQPPTAQISMNGDAARTIEMVRHTAMDAGGHNLTIIAGGASIGATNKDGGILRLAGGISRGSGSSSIEFYTSSANTGGGGDNPITRKMVLAENGNLGIGANPTAALHVQRNTAADMNIIGSGDTDNYSLINLWSMSGGVPSRFWQLSHKQSIANKFQVAYYNGTSWVFPMTIDTGGQVGIGTDSPDASALLHVNGNAVKPGGGTWGTPSDARLKKNIRPLSDALSRMLALHGVYYEWIDPKNQGNLTGPQMGMIGQEVEKVFPDWIAVNDKGYRILSIRGFEALTVESIRNLKEENDSLKSRIERLEKELQRLKEERGAP